MKERPIIFSGPMVRAILDGKKTQTRRVVKPQPTDPYLAWSESPAIRYDNARKPKPMPCPYGQPGDRLWVRETWSYYDWTEDGEPFIIYRASNKVRLANGPMSDEWHKKNGEIWEKLSERENFKINLRACDQRWRPSIHMPRWASRITLEITDVRVERVQDISEKDAIAEGLFQSITTPVPMWSYRSGMAHVSPIGAFKSIWDSINAKRGYGWDANPWVWAITFKRLA